MDEWERRRRRGRGATVMGFGVATTVALVATFYLNGCGGKGTTPTGEPNKLASRLAGEWAAVEDESNDRKVVKLFFTRGTNKLIHSYTERVKLPMQSRMDPPVYTGEERKQSHTYDIASFGDRSIRIKNSLDDIVIEFEFVTEDEFVAVYQCKWNNPPKVQGRFRRVTPRPTASDTSPIALANQHVQRIEQKLQKVESLQRQAQQERDDLVAKLRELGVESPADLKKNPRAQRTAENLAKLAAEIESMDTQLATIDSELLKARSIVRRMEREQAGISDDEMRNLSQQLRDAEERTDATPRPITPLDVDAALNVALRNKKPSEKK